MKRLVCSTFNGTQKIVAIITVFVVIVGCNSQLISKPDGGSNLQKSNVAAIYYIIGYDVCSGVQVENETAKAGGYLLVSKDLTDTLAVYNFPDSLFNFPAGIMPTNVFGFNVFPKEYHFTYGVYMTYRAMTKDEQQKIVKPCNTLYLQLYHIQPHYIVITSISKE